MNWPRLFSPCLFGHAEPLKAMRGKVFVWECSRCLQTLRKPLPHQRLKATPAAPPRPKLKKVIGGRFV
jgi:hypothetical protein